MSNPIFDTLTSHAREGTLTVHIVLDQMAEDRKTAGNFDPNEYGSQIEANAAWWCLQKENREHVLGLPKEEQEQIANAILSETAWGPMFSRDFEPDVFDYLAELSSQRDVLMAGVQIAGKDGWIEWALTHFEKAQVRAIIFHCLQKQPETAKAFFGSIGSGWNATFWGLFDTVPLFTTAIKAVTPHAPSRLISCWSHIGAYLTKVGNGHTLDQVEHSWDFLPRDEKEARKLAKPSMEHVMEILQDAFENLGENDWMHVSTLRHLPLDFRLTALGYVKRLNEGIELSIDLLFALSRDDERSQAVLEGLLSRMTTANAPFVYVHALACKMDKKPGDFGYTRIKKTRGGRHHASRSQRGIWDDRVEEKQKELLKSRVRKAWFYPQLRAHLIDCGWKFISPQDLKWRNDRCLGQHIVHGQKQTMVCNYLYPHDELQWLHNSSKLDILVPMRPWREADETDELRGTRYLTFHNLLPIFDAPLRMDLFEEFEKKAIEAAERRKEQKSRRHHRRF